MLNIMQGIFDSEKTLIDLCRQIDAELRNWRPCKRSLIVAIPFSFTNLLSVCFDDKSDSFELSLKLDTGQISIFGVSSLGQQGAEALVVGLDRDFNIGTGAGLVIRESYTDLSSHVEESLEVEKFGRSLLFG